MDMFNNGNNKTLQSVIDAASKILMGVQDQSVADAQTEDQHPIAQAQMAEAKMKMKDKMDPVGKEDDDVDNDGDSDDSDDYLKARRKAISKKVAKEEMDDIDTTAVDKALAHDCAKHVVHEFYGNGECISGMHTIEESVDGEAYVTHYDVMFQDEDGVPYILEDVAVEDLEVTLSESHMHTRKKKK